MPDRSDGDHGEGIDVSRPETATGPMPSPCIRRGHDFPLSEASRLLREGVYLPDYPTELVAAAWQINYDGAMATLAVALGALGNQQATNWERVQAAGLILSRHLDQSKGTTDA